EFVGAQAVSPDYFRQLRIPVLQGRILGAQDGADAPPVAVISDSVARRWWPRGDSPGRRIRMATDEPWITIVGVVADIDQSTLSNRVWPTVYRPISQAPPQSATFLVRTAAAPMSFAAAARSAVTAADPYQALFDIRTLRQLATDNRSGIEFSAHMMIAFGAIALLLAAAGIYAVMTYAVNQRTREIGIRMAVGANRGQVMRMVLGNSLTLAAAGLAIGLPVAFGLSRVMASLLVGVVHLDGVVFAAFAAVLAMVAAAAAYFPALRAMRVDPMIALRSD
ncbi:MAG: ABC transporter permease, partial [Acidobacteria bacterium]|nr:ABC transporter permease [Acidobacteriota bacterium]